MKYIILSFLLHIFLFLFFIFKSDNQYRLSGGKEGGSQNAFSKNGAQSIFHLENEISEQKNDVTKEKEEQIEENLQKEDDKNIEAKAVENIESQIIESPIIIEKIIKKEDKKKEKKDKPKKKNSKNKIDKENKKLDKNNRKNNLNEKDNGNNEGQGNNGSNRSGNRNGNGQGNGYGNATGDSKGNGKGDSINGMGSANIKEDAAIASSISQIQDKIMQYWSPPEEFAARKDIVIEVELALDSQGNIVSYKLLNQKNTREYQMIAASVIRVLNDPRVVPLPIMQNKKFNNIILSFCPRDLL